MPLQVPSSLRVQTRLISATVIQSFMDTNMKNLSMFGKLKYYNRDENYYDSHQYFQILVDGKSIGTKFSHMKR